MKKLFHNLKAFSQSHIYWIAYIAGGLALLGVALYFQYVNDELPCVTCIQIRMWISLLVVISIIGFITRNNRLFNVLSNVSVFLIAVALVERSYLLLGTERGFVFADCGFTSGLPEWFALEQWLPWLYQIETSCSYTPEILFGITMAESLMAMSILLVLFSLAVAVTSFIRKPD